MSAETHEVEIMKNYAVFFRQLDAFCAKLNDGLTAVAVVLALLVAAEAAIRLPEALDAAPQLLNTENLSTVAEGGH